MEQGSDQNIKDAKLSSPEAHNGVMNVPWSTNERALTSVVL